MHPKTTRRRLLAVAGATAFAGCTSIVGQGPSGSNATPTSTTTGGTPTGGGGTGPVEHGTVVDDFESLDRWYELGGTMHADRSTAYAGSQSVRVEATEGDDLGGIARSFDGLDLSTHDLSAAVRLERPASGSGRRIAAVALAPGRSDSVVMKRYLPAELDGWVRVDFGATGLRGDPQLDQVLELRFVVVTGGGEPVRFWLDDLRTVPRADRGYAVFQFDDTLASHYETVFPIMQERGYAGVESVVPSVVGREGRLDTGQLRRMQSAGWDVVSKPQQPKPLPAYSRSEQRRAIERAHDYLTIKGFSGGPAHMVAPYHRLSAETIEVAGEFHDAAYLFGGSPTPVATTEPLATARVNGDSRTGLRHLAPIAARLGQALVMHFPDVSEGGEMDEAAFREVLGIVEDAGLEPVTATELAAKRRELLG